MSGAEGDKSNIIRFPERLVPKDALPTVRYFYAKFPNFNEYSPVIPADRMNLWSGVTVVDGLQSTIQIANINRESAITITNDRAVERWTLREDWKDSIVFSLDSVEIPPTILTQGKPLLFTRTSSFGYDKRLGFPYLSLFFKNAPHWSIGHGPKKPSEFPFRFVSDIDYEQSYVHEWRDENPEKGFGTVENGVRAMLALKGAIESAASLLGGNSPDHLPSSGSLTDPNWSP